MEEVLAQSQHKNRDKEANVILDMESLAHPPDKCSGSPKMTKTLSRKGSYRMEIRGGEEQEADESSKKLVIKVVCSQLDQLKQPLVANKVLSGASTASGNPGLADSLDGRSKRFNRLKTINPRKILLLFASMEDMPLGYTIFYAWRSPKGSPFISQD